MSTCNISLSLSLSPTYGLSVHEGGLVYHYTEAFQSLSLQYHP